MGKSWRWECEKYVCLRELIKKDWNCKAGLNYGLLSGAGICRREGQGSSVLHVCNRIIL